MTAIGFQRICVLGLGYIGLPTASVLASRGVSVTGVDVRQSVVDTINRGAIHILEPELEAVTAHAVRLGLLRASLQPAAADAFIVAVPTPFHDGKADLTYVDAAARSLAPHLQKGNLIIVESTCPPGTTEEISRTLASLRPDLAFPQGEGDLPDMHIAYCPSGCFQGVF